MRCRDAYVFLCSKVWFVPCLNLNEEIVFHILILEEGGAETMTKKNKKKQLNLGEVIF